jgi:hypothetical protein
MRFNEFIIEGALSSRDFYKRNRLINLIDKLENKKPFFTLDGEQVVITPTPVELDKIKGELRKFPSEEANAIATSDVYIPTKIGGVKLSSLTKTNEFGGKVGLSTTGEMDYSKANLGPTVEALKSFAIFAKLALRDRNTITADDVIEIGKKAEENSKEQPAGTSDTPTTFAVYDIDVPDINKEVNDNIKLQVALSTPSFKRAVNVNEKDKTAWGNLKGIIRYVNDESDINKYSRFFQKNNKRDPLNIKVVGIGGAKTDISSTYVDPNGIEKPIQNLSMSIKSAGAEWYDQASAGNEAGMIKFYNIVGLSENDAVSVMKEANFKGGGKKSSNEEFELRIAAVNKIYELTANLLKDKIPELNDNGEATYIKDFLKKLKESLAGDERLVYVKFDVNGLYKKLKPHLLENLADSIDLDVKFTAPEGKSKPKISWIDTNSGKEIIHVRLLVNAPNKRLTHQFNLGENFFDILEDDKKESDKEKISTPINKSTPDIGNLVHAIIVRNQLPLQQETEILAQANELLKAGYNYNQIEKELINQFSQAEPVQQPIEPSQQPIEPVQQPVQQPAQQDPEQPKQRLGHLRQGSEEESESKEKPMPGGFFAKYGYPQKMKESDDQILAMIRGF